MLAIALFLAGRGPEGLARLAFLPAAPAEVPRQDTDALVLRGMAKVMAEDLAAAVADLTAAAARLRAGVPLRTGSQCLSYLATAEWRLGRWDDAVVHAELAVSLARDAERVWELAMVRGRAAMIPRCAASGRWPARTCGWSPTPPRQAGSAVANGATAQEALAAARGDLEGAAAAAAALRATGKTEFLGGYEWRIIEIDALIGLGRIGQAAAALTDWTRSWPRLARRRAWWPPPGCAATWPPRPATLPLRTRRSRSPGAAPRACRCR